VRKPSHLTDADEEVQPGLAAVPTLRERKLVAVREAIWDAATDLFAVRGYDETTVDEIAQAAGISPRSFFRYFLSKGDLMSYALLAYGNELVAEIDACPQSYSLREVFRETVSRVAQRGVARQLRTRKHLEILNKSAAAAAAEMSRFSEVQALVAQAYARRLPRGVEHALTAGVMAGVTLQLTGVAVRWCLEQGESDVSATMERLLASLEGMFCSAGKRKAQSGRKH